MFLFILFLKSIDHIDQREISICCTCMNNVAKKGPPNETRNRFISKLPKHLKSHSHELNKSLGHSDKYFLILLTYSCFNSTLP